jgi:hypothetical protein
MGLREVIANLSIPFHPSMIHEPIVSLVDLCTDQSGLLAPAPLDRSIDLAMIAARFN